MAVDPKHPGDVGRDFAFKLLQRVGDFQNLDLALGAKFGLGLGEQHFRLEHETVAHHQYVGALRQDLAKPAEEFLAIARQLLDLLGQRRIKPLAQIGDLGVGLDVTGFGIRKQRIQ